MSNINIKFEYKGNTVFVQSQIKDKIKDVIKKYATKINKKYDDLMFLVGGQIILDFEKEIQNFNIADNQINIVADDLIKFDDDDEEISIVKNSKQIICPKCTENCLIIFDNYKITLNNCDSGHITEKMFLKDFNGSQKVDSSKIKCSGKNCKETLLSKKRLLYCIQCDSNFCILCNTKHIANNKDHIVIDYDFKNYVCKKHGERYSAYCPECKKNLCGDCEIEHDKNHKFIYHREIAKNKDENNLKELKMKIDKLNEAKKDIKEEILNKDIINKVIENLKKIYEIGNNLIYNYTLKNKNYQLLMNFINVNKYNEAIIKDIDNILNENNIEKKVKLIKEMHDKMEKKEEIFNLKYKIGEEDRVRIFGEKFVKKNKANFKIMINNKLTGLKSFLNKKDLKVENGEFAIKLKKINDVSDLSYMFYDCSALLFPEISDLNTKNVTDMSFMFSQCESLTSLPDISKWDIQSLNNMRYMFDQCSSLTIPPGIPKWKTHNVCDISGLFKGCKNLKSLTDISNWDISKVKNISCIFQGCTELLSLPDISHWDTGNVEDMNSIFDKCVSLTSMANLSKWDTKKVTNMYAMFRNCPKLTSLPDISCWNTSNVTNMKAIFDTCSSLSEFPDISEWNTSKVSDMSFMFNQCKAIASLPDISKWDISKVTDMKCMFQSCSSLSSLPDFSKWNVSKDVKKDNMFNKCDKLTSLPDFVNSN